MRGQFYPKLAADGIRKNRRLYGPYLLTCIGMVMMYYILHFLVKSKQVAGMKGGGSLQEMLSLGSIVFAVFALIFLFYTNSFLIRSRMREFGLYNILGMGKGNLARIMAWESLITAGISLAGGLFCGILFSKAAELCMACVLQDNPDWSFTVDLGSVLRTAELFAGIFLLILIHALIRIARSKPVDLLRSTSVGEKPPKANWFLAVAGVVILGAAYYIAVSIDNPIAAFTVFFIAVAMVVVATYLLFIAGSVVLCRLLQKNRAYYYKANHFISVSSMTYRMKRNGAGLASICVLSTIVLVMLSAVVCLYIGNEDRLLSQYPRQLEYSVYTFDEEKDQKVQSVIDEVLAQNGLKREKALDYHFLSFSGYFEEDQVLVNTEKLNQLNISDYSQWKEIMILTVADYNRLMNAEETLGEGEVIAYSGMGTFAYDTVTIEGCGTMTVKKYADSFMQNETKAILSIVDTLYLFVKDEKALDSIYQEIEGKSTFTRLSYHGFDISGNDELQESMSAQIGSRLDDLGMKEKNFPTVFRSCRAEERADFYGLYSGMFVLGILLGIVFLAATVLIMYYKQITEGYEDQAKFDIMQKVGMTKKEIRKSIHSQMLTVFLAPLIMAGVHTAFAFPIVRKLLVLFGVVNGQLLMAVTAVCFLVFAVFYTLVYAATSRAYYRIVA